MKQFFFLFQGNLPDLWNFSVKYLQQKDERQEVDAWEVQLIWAKQEIHQDDHHRPPKRDGQHLENARNFYKK